MPAATPSNNPRSNAFPAWRLKNGVINPSEGELEESGESCERWGGFGAGLVVLGVIVEVAIAAYHPPYDSFLEQWGSAVANSLVALGVAAEVQFGRMGHRPQSELQRRSNQKLAVATKIAGEANAAAAEAIKETESIKEKISWRRLTMKQFDCIVVSMRERPVNMAVRHVAGDPESERYAGDIAQAFIAAGSHVTHGGIVKPDMLPGLSLSPFKDGDGTGVRSVKTALKSAGLEVLLDNPEDKLVLNVGSKPPPF